MPKRRVYLETTIVSYLTGRPSRDLVIAAHQELTLEWWEYRDKFSPPVICTPEELGEEVP